MALLVDQVFEVGKAPGQGLLLWLHTAGDQASSALDLLIDPLDLLQGF
jgi:hypothetical protein